MAINNYKLANNPTPGLFSVILSLALIIMGGIEKIVVIERFK